MADRNRRIAAWRCRAGHLWLFQHADCPDCGACLVETRIGAGATIVTHTVVRVNPTGVPLRLGVAATAAGASTLCVVAGPIRGNGRDRVRLVLEDGLYVAVPRRRRVRLD